MCRNAEKIYDSIAKLGYNSELEKKKKIEEFIEKGVVAHLNDGVDRTIKEKESRESYLKEIEKFRKEQVITLFLYQA